MRDFFKRLKGDKGRVLLTRFIIVIIGFLVILVLSNQFGSSSVTEPYVSAVIVLLACIFIFFIILFRKLFSLIDLGFVATCFFSLFLGLTVSWILREYRFGFHGSGADAYLNLAMISTYYDQWVSSDFTYQGKSSFYPYYFQYVLGKLGRIFNQSPNVMAKYGVIFTVYFVPIASYTLWNYILKKKMLAFFITVIVFLAMPYPFYIKPYKIIVIALIIPWFYYFFVQNRSLTKWQILVGGIMGGLLFGTYYFFFFLFVIFVLISIFNTLYDNRSQLSFGYLKSVLRSYKSQMFIIIVTFIVASPYIVPYVYDLLTHPFDSAQNKFFLPNSIKFNLFSFENVWVIAALIFLATDVKNKLSAYLLKLLLACLLFVLIGYIGLISGKPVLVSHVYPFIWVIIYISLALLIEKLIRSYNDHLIVNTMMVLSIVAIFQQSMIFIDISRSKLKELEFSTVPVIVGNHEIVEELKGTILLTNTKINGFIPVSKFVENNSFYAHPSSETMERTKFLKALFFFNDKRFQTLMLQYNRFDEVEYIVYRGMHGKMLFNISHFPYTPFFKSISFNLDGLTKNNPNLDELPTKHRYFKVYKLQELDLSIFKELSDEQKRFAYMFGNKEVSDLLSGWQIENPKENSNEYLGDLELYNLDLFNTLQNKEVQNLFNEDKKNIEVKAFDSPFDSSKIVVFGIDEYYVYRKNYAIKVNDKPVITLEVKLFNKDSVIEKKRLDWNLEKINSYRREGIVYEYFHFDKYKEASKLNIKFKSTRYTFNEDLEIPPYLKDSY